MKKEIWPPISEPYRYCLIRDLERAKNAIKRYITIGFNYFLKKVTFL